MNDLKIALKAFFFYVTLLFTVPAHAQTAQFDKFFAQASALIAKEDYEPALLQLKQVTDKDPNNVRAIEFASFVYGKLKNYKEAASRSVQLTKLLPDNANHFTSAGWYLMLNKEYAEAEKYCLHALSLNDCSYAIYLNLGHVYAFLKQESKCQEFYKKAASYIPNKEAYEQSILPDFELLAKEKDFPYDTEMYKNMFVSYFNNQYSVKEYGSGILDSIYYLRSFQNYSATDELIIDLKERFLKEELKNKSYRLYVMRDFFWSLGWLHFNRGSKTISINEYFMKVINISTDFRDTSFIVDVLYQVGDAFSSGDDNTYKEGVALMKQAMGFALQSNNINKQYIISIMLGDKMRQKQDHDAALTYYRQSLLLADKSEEPNAKIPAINRMMLVFGEMKKIDSVTYYYALSKNEANNASSENNFIDDLNYCSLLTQMGKPREAIVFGKGFIKLYQGKKNIDVSDLYEKIGIAHSRLTQIDSAIFFHKEAIRLYTVFIQNNEQSEHKVPQKERMESFSYLKRTVLAKNDINELFNLSEQSRANILYPVVTGKNDIPKNSTISSVAKDLKNDEVAISFSNSYKAKEGFAIAITSNAELLVKEDHVLLDSLVKKHAEINWNEALHTANFVEQSGKLAEDPEESRTSMLALSIIANNLNNMMVGGFTRSTIKKENSKSKNFKAEMIALNDVVYQMYFKPFEKILSGKKTIYLSADIGTTLIPFEVLQNEKGEYLGSLYNFIYVPSFTSRQILKSKIKPGKKQMLAFGNAGYKNFNPRDTKGRAYDLAQGFAGWGDLPGTKEELSSIRDNIPSATIIDQANLNESRIKSLSNSGELAAYDILHFAVHGMASQMDFRDHSLIVSEPPQAANDGLLQFNEIANLKIGASLVCLSACETALTIPGEGEEIKNLPMAFFMAGAQSVIATWWRIDDAATALFMSSFYSLVFKENKPYSSALHLTRQKFIRGEFGEKYKAPYYWGAFKYFGY